MTTRERVHYHTSKEMRALLDGEPGYRDKLYCRGFLICCDELSLDGYPFYGNWNVRPLGKYLLYSHNETQVTIYRAYGTEYFIIGHAYNPFDMEYDETELLRQLAGSHRKGDEAYWDKESELTGVFCTGFAGEEELVISTDCCGMQLVNYGVTDSKLYITSHSRLISDICGKEQDDYVREVINSRFYHFWGTWLPGDISAFKELKRLQPNHCAIYDGRELKIERYYPTERIVEAASEEEYRKIIEELASIMKRSLELISEKWKDKNVAISVTGGRDSMTTYACANGIYDRFKYFSYISNDAERVDAVAAEKICSAIGTPHSIYIIPGQSENCGNVELFRKILECNSGCIGHNNENDVRKRLWFSEHGDIDVEVKSWVNELGRGWYYNKYKMDKFPTRPYPAYLRSMHKVYLTPSLIKKTNRIFGELLDKYYIPELFDGERWLDFYMWEFSWGGAQGVYLTGEQRTSNEITVPYNNRKYVERMLRLPLEKRKKDKMPDDIINITNPDINSLGIVVKNIKHNSFRALMDRTYLSIFKNFRF